MILLSTVLPVLLVLLLIGLGWRLTQTRRELRTLAARLARQRVEEQRQLRLQVAADERERIYADLHDDLGAKLLSLIYNAQSPVQADLARAILQDLRDVVTRSRGEPGTLGDVLAQIEAEARQRLAAVKTELVWDSADDLPDPPLDQGEALHLFRIVREGISNAIRHAEAKRLRVRVRRQRQQLLLDITDDGSGIHLPLAQPGRGMQNMQQRAAELHGQIDWSPGTTGGTKILLTMPLRDAQSVAAES